MAVAIRHAGRVGVLTVLKVVTELATVFTELALVALVNVTGVGVLLVVIVVGAAVMRRVRSGVTTWTTEPLAPVTLTVNVPVDEVVLAIMVKVELTEPPETGVAGELISRVTPAGVLPSHEVNSVTGELNPFRELTVIDVKPLPPWVIVRIELEEAIVKSAKPVLVEVVTAALTVK